MQSVDFSKIFKTLDGRDVKDDLNASVSLRSLCCNLLVGFQDGDDKLSGVDKVKRYKLAQRIYDSNSSIELESEDITMLKELIAKASSPLIVGQAFEWLDPPVDCS